MPANVCSLNSGCTTKLKQCQTDCAVVVDTANKTIADLTQVHTDDLKTIEDQATALDTVSADRDSYKSALNSWYHDPIKLFILGAIAGGVGVLVLERR